MAFGKRLVPYIMEIKKYILDKKIVKIIWLQNTKTLKLKIAKNKQKL